MYLIDQNVCVFICLGIGISSCDEAEIQRCIGEGIVEGTQLERTE
jgi:hypothetical protein